MATFARAIHVDLDTCHSFTGQAFTFTCAVLSYFFFLSLPTINPETVSLSLSPAPFTRSPFKHRNLKVRVPFSCLFVFDKIFFFSHVYIEIFNLNQQKFCSI